MAINTIKITAITMPAMAPAPRPAVVPSTCGSTMKHKDRIKNNDVREVFIMIHLVGLGVIQGSIYGVYLFNHGQT